MLANLKPACPAPEPADEPGHDTPCVSSRDLFGDEPVVHIRHEGTTYILRKTRNGKLILTK